MESEAPYSPVAVANAFLKRAQEEGEPVTPMKLLKLVYYAYGWHLALTDEKLFEEGIEAWKHGPVVNSLWGVLQGEGEIVQEPIQPFFGSPPDIDSDDKFTQELIDEVWDAYGDFRASKLRNLTHMPNTPWHQVHKKNEGELPDHEPIEDWRIEEYFRSLLEESRDLTQEGR